MLLLSAYHRALHQRPLLTQMISAGVVGCCGDALSQLFVEKKSLSSFDFARSARFFLLPTFYIAPILSHWFTVLERVKGSSRIAPLKKLVIDQICFAPIFSASIIFNLRLLEGFSPRDSLMKLKEDYWPIYKRSIQYWPIVQLINFYVIPLYFRVVFVQLAALFWNVFLSHKTQSTAHLPIPPLE